MFEKWQRQIFKYATVLQETERVKEKGRYKRMNAGIRKLHVQPGNPALWGAVQTPEGFNFTVAVPEGKEASLLLYKKRRKEVWVEIPLKEEERVGNVSSILVKGLEAEAFAYNYRIDGTVTHDIYTRELYGRGNFGQEMPENPDSIASLIPEKPVMKTLPLKLPYENMILYKTHVRGFTKDSGSKVQARGTFQGIREKISYLKELGINALELMPVYEFFEVQEEQPRWMPAEDELVSPAETPARINYWGYATRALYFSPKASFSATGHPVQEFAELVDALHEAGIECILEFYFGPELSMNFILGVLHYWQLTFHVDGFHLIGEGAKVVESSRDELLKKTKLIFLGFDPSHVYGEGNAPAFRNLGEHNQGYQEMMRRYLKGDEGCVSGFTYYLRRNPATHGVINYFADHDGFTMADMVSYERKHNMSNGDDNTDGTSSNYSWNCGAEGVTRKKAVHHLRMQQLKNAFLMLLTSQGTPMIYGGDEFLNSQKGNNNAWCQDNRTGWVNWNIGKEGRELLEFVKQLIRFRKEHPVLHTPKEMRLMDYQGAGCPDLSYHSQRAWFSQMENTCRFIGVMYCGDYAVKENGEPDDYLYLGFNMHWNPHELALPSLPKEHVWYRAVDTSREECFAEERAEIVEGKSITVPPRSIVILIGRQA